MSLFCVSASCLLTVLVISFFLLLLDLFHYQSHLKINLALKASFSFTIQEQIAIVLLDYWNPKVVWISPKNIEENITRKPSHRRKESSPHFLHTRTLNSRFFASTNEITREIFGWFFFFCCLSLLGYLNIYCMLAVWKESLLWLSVTLVF